MPNKNAVKRAARNFAAGIAVMMLAACGQNPGGSYSADSSPILPAMADTPGSSLDLQIPLDTAVIASNPQRFAVRGKYIAIDPGSTGQANLRINSISDTPRLAYPGSQFSPGAYTDLYFDYQAQPGKFLHVLYGDSPDILSAGIKSISDPALLGTLYTFRATQTGAAVLVNNSITIVPATTNINGIKLLSGSICVKAKSAGGASTAWSELFLQYVDGAQNPHIADISSPVIFNGDTGIRATTLILPQLNIPPNAGLQFTYNLNSPAVNDFSEVDIIFNYQIL